jgi:HD-like signal output (HDOD) protein
MSERLRARQAPEDSMRNCPNQITRLPGRRPGLTSAGVVSPRSDVSLNSILARIQALPALSPVVVRVLQMTDRESVATRDIVSVINSDVRFSMRVVKAANAPCYGLPRVVASVNEAMQMLGTGTFREVILVAASRALFYRPLPGYGLSENDLWEHSLACGMAAEIVADLTGYSNRTEAFIAGLAHDVGKIVLDEDMQVAMPLVRESMIRDNCSLLDAERAILGFDHCDIGARVVRSWGLPHHIVQAVALHRKPIVSRQTVPLAGYVHIGEILCSLAGVGLGFEGLDITLETQVLTDFKFTENLADTALSRLVDAVSASQTLFR